MNIQLILKNFGLNDKEISVYLTLVELGPSPVRVVAAKSKVNRGTTYDILRGLMEQGLVTFYHKTSKQYFTAEPPEKLITALEDKQKNLEKVKVQIKESLPQLQTMFEKEGGRPTVKLYEGLKGIRSILEDVLESVAQSKDKVYYVYSSSNIRNNVHTAMPEFTQKRVNSKIRVRTIALGPGGSLAGLDERKWLPLTDKEPKVTYELIYNGKVAHISLDNAKNPIGVVIENEEIYQTQKMIFEFNWEQIRS